MKKSITIILSFLLCLLSLSGCSCKHDWTDADCLNPKTCNLCNITEGEAIGHNWSAATCETPEICANCGETKGEAIGHQWAAATCETPETCNACGKTQGEIPDHDFGSWTIDGDTMSRICASCNKAESTKTDHELIATQGVIGHWDLYLLTNGAGIYSCHDLSGDIVMSWVAFREDNTATIALNGEEFHGTWKYDRMDMPTTGIPNYYFAVTLADGSGVIPITYYEIPDYASALVLTVDSVVLHHSKNAELAELMEGAWVASYENDLRVMTLNPDRTITFHWDENMTGMWHLRSEFTDPNSGMRTAGLTLTCTKDGISVTETIMLDLLDESVPLEVLGSYVSIHTNQIGGSFSKSYGENIEILQEELENAKMSICGSWESTRYLTYTYETGNTDIKEIAGYEITFSEDGTFIGLLDQEYTGTWEYIRNDIVFGEVQPNYTMHIDGIDDEITIVIFDGKLSIMTTDDITAVTLDLTPIG